MNKKVIIGISIIAVTIIIILLGINIFKKDANNKDISNYPNIEGKENTKEENGNKVNISTKIKKQHIYSHYKITNARLEAKDGTTTFYATIKNKTNKKQIGHVVEIIFLDKKGNEVSKMGSYIRELEGSQQIELTASIGKDLSNAYDYKIVKK